MRCDHLLSRSKECADLSIFDRFYPRSKFNDVECSGHLSTSKTDEHMAQIKELVHENIYAEVAFEGGKWGDRPRPRSFYKKNCCPQTGKNFMNNEKIKFARQVAKVDLI